MIDYTEDYLAFYETYPRHEGKQDGQKAWNTMTDGAKGAATADVEKRKRLGAYSANKKKIQLPASYLRSCRWEDDWEATLKSSRGDDNKPNTGVPEFTPRDEGLKLSKWASLANRWTFRWFIAYGLRYPNNRSTDPNRGIFETDELIKIVDIKNRAVAEMSGALDEDLAADDSRESQTEAIWTFLNVLVDRLDAAFGHEIKPQLLKGANQ